MVDVVVDRTESGFAGEEGLSTLEYVLRAKDGYTVPLRGSKVFEAGATLKGRSYVAMEYVRACRSRATATSSRRWST